MKEAVPVAVILLVAAGALALFLVLRSSGVPGEEHGAGIPTPSFTGQWPMFRGDPSLRGVAQTKLPDKLVLWWRFQTGAAVNSSAAVDGRTVYVGSLDGNLYALDTETGEKRWSFASEDTFEASPLVLDGTVYIGSSDTFLYAVRDGALVWKYETDDKILGAANWVRSPAGDAVWILVGSYDCMLHCVDATAGTRVWTYETDNYVNGTPAVADGRIVFGGCDAGLHVVSGETGEALEKVELGEACHVAGSVALDGSRVYLGHYGNAVICAELSTPEVLWVYPSREAFFSSPALGPDRLVLGGRDRQMHCIQRADGAPLWQARTKRRVDASPVICGG